MDIRPKSSMRSRPIGRRAFVGFIVLAMFALPISATSASSKSCTSSVGTRVNNRDVCKGLAFYKGQTVVYITGSAGGGTDILARALAPLVGQYLGATIVVSNQGQTNGIPGQDALASAPPTGLEFGFVNAGSIASLMLTKQPGFNFNPERLSYIAGQIATPAVLVASPTSPYATFAALKAATATSSSVKILAEFPSAGSSGLEVLLNMLGMHITWVTGYSSTTAVATGFYRGDGPVGNAPFANFESFIQGKTAVPLATSVALSPGMLLRGLLVNTPTYTSLLKTYGPKHITKAWKTAAQAENDFVRLGQPLVTQTRVSAYKVETLRAAVAWAWTQTAFINADLSAGNNPTYVNPAAAKANFIATIKAGAALTRYLPETTP